MTDFATQITRAPLAYDLPAAGDVAQAFAGHAAAPLLVATAACSPYLRALIRREEDWLKTALALDPTDALAQVMAEMDTVTLATLAEDLRCAKRRAALLCALADLGGVWPTMTVTRALTDLADRAVQLCVLHLTADEIRRGKLPRAVPADAATGAGMVVLAMGKMGAFELNYSSDIDLICLFDQDRYGEDSADARAAFIRITRRMTAILSDVTDGYVFRVDLRLRPDAAVTPICLSIAAAERYYEAEGRTWERAAFIKARPCAGDIAAGNAFLRGLTPFVWRKHLDFAAIQDAHDMRLRIRAHRGLNGALRVEGHNMKLGIGGIREIEFYAQTRQLIAGGRDVTLRDPTTLGALAALAAKGWIKADDAAALSDLYIAHRDVEHRLQMVGDAQTHDMPNSTEGVARIAAFCGQTDADFRTNLLARLQKTDHLTTEFFAPEAAPATPDLSQNQQAIVAGWAQFPALRSARAQEIFARLAPVLLGRLQHAANPDEALIALDGFLAGLPAGVQIFSLFDANPQLVDLIIDIAATAPQLARYLSRHAAVLDAVIGGSFFAPWPDTLSQTADLTRVLNAAPDYEAMLDAARVWQKEWHFRIGVHFLRGLITADEAGIQYTELAGAVIAAVWGAVCADFARRHGPAMGRGAVVLSMGSLGAGRLNAASDLDLIVIYDACGIEESHGPRPLPTRQYFARLTQGFVTALSAQTAKGRLYEVDVRLRPSGRKGPVATSLASFRSYQITEAWAWEHLALTRARVLAGDTDLGADVEALRRSIIADKGQGAALTNEVAEMRARLAAAKPSAGLWDVKMGAGRMMDIELMAQTLALQSGCAAQSVPSQIAAGVLAGKVPQTDATALMDAYSLMVRMQGALRLLSDTGMDPDALGQGGRDFVLRVAGFETAADLAGALGPLAARAEQVVVQYMQGGGDDGTV